MVTATAGVGDCVTEPTSAVVNHRPVTFEVTSFNPALPATASAYVTWSYGGPDSTGATSASTTITALPHQHTRYFAPQSGGYAATGTVTITDNGRLLYAPPAVVNFAVPANAIPPVVPVSPCVPCPVQVDIVRAAPATPPLPLADAQFTASVVWAAERHVPAGTGGFEEVSGQVAARLDTLIGSPEASDAITGLRLFLWLAIEGPKRQRASQRWRTWVDESFSRYRPVWSAHLGVPDLAVAAWHRREATTEEMLAAQGGELASLFASPHIGVENIRLSSVAWSCVYEVVQSTSAAERTKVVEVLETAERHLAAHAGRPQVAGPVNPGWLNWLTDGSVVPGERPTLGRWHEPLIFLAAVCFEDAHWSEGLRAAHLGPLRDFYPYVAMRLNKDQAELPDLPVTPWLQELLVEWARGEFDFVV
ncbi:hypothetical protein AB0G05_02675 [Nonomuraea wenchangensis]